MSFELSQEEGEFLIHLARTTVKEYLGNGKPSNRQKTRQKSFLSTAEFS